MPRPAVEVSGVRKRFHVRHERRPSVKRFFVRLLRPFPHEVLWALEDIDLTVDPGETVGLIGSNGSGKSTLLRLIAGIIIPTEGTLTIRGRSGGLFELAAGFHPELNGRDNIQLSGALMGYSRAEVAAKVESIAEFSELGEFLDVPVKSYSSGMALRLGFAIAVTFEPDVLLVDEVLAVADARFQAKAYDNLRRQQDRGSAVILVSHEMAAIREMCSRAVWLEQGRIRADGPADDVIRSYLADGNDEP